MGSAERIEDARLLVGDEAPEKLREGLRIPHGGHPRGGHRDVARGAARRAEVHPEEVHVRGIRGETPVPRAGAQEQGLVACEVEAPLLLEHVQVSPCHEDQLVGVDHAHRVDPETGRDEKPAVQGLQRGTDGEGDRHGRSAGPAGWRGALPDARKWCGVW